MPLIVPAAARPRPASPRVAGTRGRPARRAYLALGFRIIGDHGIVIL